MRRSRSLANFERQSLGEGRRQAVGDAAELFALEVDAAQGIGPGGILLLASGRRCSLVHSDAGCSAEGRLSRYAIASPQSDTGIAYGAGPGSAGRAAGGTRRAGAAAGTRARAGCAR